MSEDILDLRRNSNKNSKRILIELNYASNTRIFTSRGPVAGDKKLIVSEDDLSQMHSLKYNVINDERDGETLDIDSKKIENFNSDDNNSSEDNSSEKDEQEPSSDTFLCEEPKSDGEPCTRTVESPDETCFQH